MMTTTTSTKTVRSQCHNNFCDCFFNQPMTDNHLQPKQKSIFRIEDVSLIPAKEQDTIYHQEKKKGMRNKSELINARNKYNSTPSDQQMNSVDLHLYNFPLHIVTYHMDENSSIRASVIGRRLCQPNNSCEGCDHLDFADNYQTLSDTNILTSNEFKAIQQQNTCTRPKITSIFSSSIDVINCRKDRNRHTCNFLHRFSSVFRWVLLIASSTFIRLQWFRPLLIIVDASAPISNLARAENARSKYQPVSSKTLSTILIETSRTNNDDKGSSAPTMLAVQHRQLFSDEIYQNELSRVSDQLGWLFPGVEQNVTSVPEPTTSPLTKIVKPPTNRPTLVPNKEVVSTRFPVLVPKRPPTTTLLSQIPTTTLPTLSPNTQAPTRRPVTSVPTSNPTTIQPTQRPKTNLPTQRPITNVPTQSPTSNLPTRIPTSNLPTRIPTSNLPTRIPTSNVPTRIPTTKRLTRRPTTKRPTRYPTTKRPSRLPATRLPTQIPQTKVPIRFSSNVPSQQPTGTIVSASNTATLKPSRQATQATRLRPSQPILDLTTSTPSLPFSDMPAVTVEPSSNPTKFKRRVDKEEEKSATELGGDFDELYAGWTPIDIPLEFVLAVPSLPSTQSPKARLRQLIPNRFLTVKTEGGLFHRQLQVDPYSSLLSKIANVLQRHLASILKEALLGYSDAVLADVSLVVNMLGNPNRILQTNSANETSATGSNSDYMLKVSGVAEYKLNETSVSRFDFYSRASRSVTNAISDEGVLQQVLLNEGVHAQQFEEAGDDDKNDTDTDNTSSLQNDENPSKPKQRPSLTRIIIGFSLLLLVVISLVFWIVVLWKKVRKHRRRKRLAELRKNNSITIESNKFRPSSASGSGVERNASSGIPSYDSNQIPQWSNIKASNSDPVNSNPNQSWQQNSASIVSNNNPTFPTMTVLSLDDGNGIGGQIESRDTDEDDGHDAYFDAAMTLSTSVSDQQSKENRQASFSPEKRRSGARQIVDVDEVNPDDSSDDDESIFGTQLQQAAIKDKQNGQLTKQTRLTETQETSFGLSSSYDAKSLANMSFPYGDDDEIDSSNPQSAKTLSLSPKSTRVDGPSMHSGELHALPNGEIIQIVANSSTNSRNMLRTEFTPYGDDNKKTGLEHSWDLNESPIKDPSAPSQYSFVYPFKRQDIHSAGGDSSKASLIGDTSTAAVHESADMTTIGSQSLKQYGDSYTKSDSLKNAVRRSARAGSNRSIDKSYRFSVAAATDEILRAAGGLILDDDDVSSVATSTISDNEFEMTAVPKYFDAGVNKDRSDEDDTESHQNEITETMVQEVTEIANYVDSYTATKGQRSSKLQQRLTDARNLSARALGVTSSSTSSGEDNKHTSVTIKPDTAVKLSPSSTKDRFFGKSLLSQGYGFEGLDSGDDNHSQSSSTIDDDGSQRIGIQRFSAEEGQYAIENSVEQQITSSGIVSDMSPPQRSMTKQAQSESKNKASISKVRQTQVVDKAKSTSSPIRGASKTTFKQVATNQGVRGSLPQLSSSSLQATKKVSATTTTSTRLPSSQQQKEQRFSSAVSAVGRIDERVASAISTDERTPSNAATTSSLSEGANASGRVRTSNGLFNNIVTMFESRKAGPIVPPNSNWQYGSPAAVDKNNKRSDDK